MAIRDQKTIRKRSLSELELCSAMARLSSLALSKSDPDRIISEALKEIRKTLGARICWMFLVEEDRTILKGLGDAGSRRGPAKSELLLKLSPKILKRTYPIICNRIAELYKQNRALYAFLRQRDIEKFMGVPLKKDGRSIGVLNLGRGRDAKDFTREDLKSLTMLGSVLVVGRLRAAERESGQAQSFLEGIIDNIPNPVFIKDRKHHWVVLNRAFSELVGHSREKMLGKSDHDFFPKNQADFFWKKDEEMFRTGKVVDIPVEPVTGKDGDLHHLHTKKAPLKDSSGKITHLVGIIDDISDRLQSESALRESEQKYRLLVENIKEGIYSVHQGRFTSVNESMCRMFGYSKGEMVGMPSWNLAVPEKRESARQLFFAKAAKRDFSPTEIECVRKDGSVFVAEVRLSSITGKRQSLGVVSDITERKRAEEALKESEERFRLMAETSLDYTFQTNKNGATIYCSPAIERMLGYTPEERQGMDFSSIILQSDVSRAQALFRKAIEGEIIQNVEVSLRHKSGKAVAVEVSVVPIFENKKVTGLYGVARDITERKRAEEVLRESERRYRALFNGAAEGILVADIETRKFRYANPAICKMLGYAEEELTRMRLDDIHPRDSLKHVISEFEAQARGERTLAQDIPCLRKDGTVMYVDINTTRLVIDGRKCNVGFFTDITERRQAEAVAEGERQRLFSVLDVMPALVYLQAPDYSVPFVNRRFRELFGDPGNRPCYESFYGRKKPCEPCTTLRVLKTRAPQTYEWTSKQDRTYMVHEDLFPGRDGTEMVLGTGLDITEQKRIERALVRKERIARERARVLVELHKLNQIDDILTRVCKALRDSGLFERAVMTLHEPGGRICHVGQVGLPAAVVRRAQRAAPMDRKLKKRITSKKFRISDSFFIPGEAGVDFSKSGRHIPQKKKETVGGDWQPGDELFVPLRDFSGKIMGYLSVDTPTDGCRPDVKTVQSLEMLVEAAASRIREVQAQKALTEGEEKYRLLVDNLTDMIVEFDKEGRLLFVSPSYCQAFGKPEDEILGRKFIPLIHKDDRENVKKALADIYEPPHVAHVEERAKTVDGWRWQSWVNTAVLDENHDVVRVIAVGRDITENKRAEEALKKSEERFRTFMETARDLMNITDEKGNITYVNEAMVRTLGYSKEKMIGMHFTQLLTKEALEKDFKPNWAEFITNGEISIGTTFAAEDGKEIYGELKAVATYDRDGKLAGTRGVFHDLTERRRVEEKLLESEIRYRTLVEQLPAVTYTAALDESSTTLYISPQIEKILGISPAEHKADPDFWVKHLYPDDHERVLNEVSRSHRSGQPFNSEYRMVNRDGQLVWFRDDATIVRDDKGNPLYLQGVMFDITERKRAEEALQRSENRYRSLFEDSPISLWEEDFSEVKRYVDRLRESGVTDFRTYFDRHPKAVAKCASMVKVIDVNKASLKLYKARSKEELIAGLSEIFSRESYYPFSEELMAIAQGKTVFEREAITKTLKGTNNHVSVRWTVPPGYEETLSKVVVAVTDITEAKEAEEALRREEERYRTLVETAQEGIGIADSKENLVFVNRAFAQLLGYRRDELLGKSLAEISDPAQYEVFTEETRRRKRDQSSKYEITLLTKRGKPKPMYVSAAPLWNPDGSFRGTLGVVSDLTEIKKAREYNILLGASRSLSRTLRFDQVLKLGAEKMAQALSADRCTVMLPGDDASGLSMRLYPFPNRGKDSLFAWNLRTTKEHLSSYKRSLQAGGSIQIPNLQPDLDPNLGKGILRKSGMVSALVVPMFSRNTMLGVFHVGMRKKVRTFSLEEERLARTMANQIGVALQNCRLMEDLRKEHARIIEQTQLLSTQYREQKMMFELTQTLSSSRNLDQLLASAARKVTEFLDTERGSVVLLGPGEKNYSLRAVHVRGKTRRGRFVGSTFTFNAYPGLKDVVLKHKPFVLPDSSLLPKEDPARKYFLGRGIKSTVAVPLLSRGKCLGFLTAATVTDVHRYTKEEIRLLQTISNPVAVTIENYRLLEDLKQKYAQIEDQTTKLKKQTREKDILLRVGRALSRTMDLDEVGRVASQVVGSTLGVERCAITLVTKENYELELKGLYFKDRTQDRKLIGTKFLWNDIPDMCNMIKRRKPFVIQNTSDVYPEGKTKEYFLKAGIKSVLGTGMFFGEKLVGILSITSTKKHQTFSHEEVKLVQTLANQIGVAIENARLQEVIEKHTKDLKDLYSQLLKTQENERKRITQELHDQVGQMLQSMKMNLGRIKRNLGSKPPCLEGIEDSLLDTEELLGQTIEDIRTLTLDLSPPMLVDFGLIPTLRWFIENYGKRSGIKLSLKTKDKAYRFPQEVEFTLYRIIQEAVTNVAKHAKATEASVSISRKDSTAVLSVRDNGVGFDAAGVLSAPTGMGLLNIKERVDLLGGTFEIISRPRKGTKLNIQIPFSGGAV